MNSSDFLIAIFWLRAIQPGMQKRATPSYLHMLLYIHTIMGISFLCTKILASVSTDCLDNCSALLRSEGCVE